ncbi:MAG: hypothetical protein LUQ32_01160 [Methanomicrobiales archaeon]|nr:hypothetical protein [Methanomicrobiales archaeon]
MAKVRRVPVRSFGSETPEPTVRDLAEWVKERKGVAGDLTTYLLEESLNPQEGVDLPCPGGRIYLSRILESFIGLEDGTLTREPAVDTALVEEDARWGAARSKGLWFSIPAPHLLGIRDKFYHDREEFCEGICTCYKQIMRAMRDSGAGGHVLLGDEVNENDLEHLAGPRTFFFSPDLGEEDLSAILEVQNAVAVPRSLLSIALDILDEYDLRSLSIVDGIQEDFLSAAEYLDPEQISFGGYCKEECGKYWKDLVERAVIPR